MYTYTIMIGTNHKHCRHGEPALQELVDSSTNSTLRNLRNPVYFHRDGESTPLSTSQGMPIPPETDGENELKVEHEATYDIAYPKPSSSAASTDRAVCDLVCQPTQQQKLGMEGDYDVTVHPVNCGISSQSTNRNFFADVSQQKGQEAATSKQKEYCDYEDASSSLMQASEKKLLEADAMSND